MTAESANRLAARLLRFTGLHTDPRELIAMAVDRERTLRRIRKHTRYRNSEQVRSTIRDQVRRWRTAHPELLKAQRARYKRRRRELRGPAPARSPLTEAERIEHARESRRRWNQANREKVRAAVKRWCALNPEKYKAQCRRANERRKLRKQQANNDDH